VGATPEERAAAMPGDAYVEGGPPARVVMTRAVSIRAAPETQRVESFGARGVDPQNPETGARDQYQLYEVIYASGEGAGVAGVEGAREGRRSAVEDGVIEEGGAEGT
jgi:hypothetical protein